MQHVQRLERVRPGGYDAADDPRGEFYPSQREDAHVGEEQGDSEDGESGAVEEELVVEVVDVAVSHGVGGGGDVATEAVLGYILDAG